ncbi:hypothetical protein GS399_11065 [Pedobacter sp. HMF7647]|uniref:Uncharacterized protein n=1 Tax=Hufsiella arboris TaxID=2695275 RepID=A0A7K1YAY8_9SPHI|nr:hypothetical protein [Hufsiella arboris]MXV51511.1 hypothetical protein [Hufsiella arboris]
MKILTNILAAVAVATVMAASCKKDSGPSAQEGKPDQSAEKYPVSFTVNGFGLDLKDMGVNKNGATISGLKDQIHYLYYGVYRETYDEDHFELVHSISQDSLDKNFGTIKDSLPGGNYFIGFIASKDPTYRPGFVSGRGTIYTHPSFSFTTDFGTDVFYKGIKNFAVTSPSTNVQNVTLSRGVSKLGFKFLDEIPYNASKLVIRLYSEQNGFDLFDGEENWLAYRDWERLVTINLKDADKGKKGAQFCIFIYGNSFYENLSFTLYDRDGHVIASKVVAQNSSYKTNTEYIYSGYLMPQNNAVFKVTVNDTWDSPVNIGF